MAKTKRKKLKNVQINNGELVPTTIGYLNSKQKGSFLLIFIFAVLFATLYYMPQITNYINKYINPSAYEEAQTPVVVDEDNTGIVEEMTPELVLNINGVKFSNFAIKNGELSYAVDESLKKDDFTNYYLETFDRDSKLLERNLISSTSILTIPLNHTNVKFVSINHYDEGSYPNVILKNSKLTCQKDEETYEYVFQTGGLSSIIYTFKMTKTDENVDEYIDMLSEYEEKAANIVNGISSSLSSQDSSFTYSTEEDLLVLNNSTLENGFDYQSKADMIAFIMSTKGYKCN